MKQFLITITIILAMVAHSIVIADPLEREQLIKECMEQLRAIGKAIEAYKAEHQGEMPDWLSDLYPKYLQDPEILICAADKTGGTPAAFTAYKDPKMPCSYLYEFNPMKLASSGLFDINPPKDLTYKAAKTMQLKYFGNMVPVVRCRHHGTQLLNLDYDGRVYLSPPEWEWTPEAIKVVLSFFQSAMEQNPDGWEKEFSLKEIYSYFRGRGRLPDFRALLEKQSNLSVDALKILAETYQSEEKIDEAIEIYHQLVNIVENNIDARFQLAKLYAKAKNYQSAREQCKQIIQLEPDNSKVYALLAELDATDDGHKIKKSFLEMPAKDLEMHYLVKLEEILLTSKKEFKPAVKKAHAILQESFGEPTSVARLGHLYQTLDKSLASHSGQWKTYTTSDGLINDHVSAITQDARGILWIGTLKGVCKYDGENFIPFTISKELRDSVIPSILIDKKEHIWFGTNSHGVVQYDGENVINYTVEDGLAGNYVNEIFQDRNGFLWFACGSGAISRYDGKTFTNFTTEDGLAHNQVYTIMEDSRGNIWIGTRGGVSKYDGKTFTNLTEAEGLAGNRVNAIVEDRDGYLWFGTTKGISRYDGGKFTNFTTRDGLIGNDLGNILEDCDSTNFTPLIVEGQRVPGRVSAIFSDSNHNLWFAIYNYALIRYDGTSYTRFTTLDGLIGNKVRSIIEDKNGSFWIGIWGGGISRYDGSSFTNLTMADGLASDGVKSLAEDNHGNIWIGTWGGGVSRYSKMDFTNFTKDDGLVDDYVCLIFTDTQGQIWVGTPGGLSKYDGTSFATPPKFAGKYITTIIEDSLPYTFLLKLWKAKCGWIFTVKKPKTRTHPQPLTHPYPSQEGKKAGGEEKTRFVLLTQSR